MLPKNIATSLKSASFLRFFWRQLRSNDLDLAPWTADYPFISPCGAEMNFVTVADTPIVFERVDEDMTTLSYGQFVRF